MTRPAGVGDGPSVAAPAVRARCLAALACGLALAACGSSSGHASSTRARVSGLPAPCQTRARTAVAVGLGVPASRVAIAASTGTNGSPQCRYAAGGRAAVANIDVTPQAYFLVERAGIEASQQFAPIPADRMPIGVDHLGLEAYWFPALQQVLTTDGVRVIQVTVSLPGASRARKVAFSSAVARTYLGRLHPPP